MEYSSVVWDPHLQKDKDALEHIQRRAARWITSDHSPYSSIRIMLSQLGLENLDERRCNQRLMMMYKTIHGVVAIEPQDLGLEFADAHTRSSHQYKLKLHRSSTKELHHSFVVRTIPEWNLLPTNLAEAGSVDHLKSQLAPCNP